MISSSPGEILDLLDEVNVVRYEAEGCRLQGGPDQLSKALLKFNDALSILNEIRGNLEVSSKWTVTYSRCLMGLAIAYADQGHIDEAESSVHGSLQLLATLVSDTEIATGQSNSDCIWLHEQLLDMICSAIKDVYFKASGDSAQSDNPYLHKAGVLLHWYAGLLVGAVSPQTLSIADACSQPVDIGRIAGVNNLLMSLMSKKLPFLSAKRAVLHKLLSLGSSLNMRYQEHEAAFRIYQHGLAQAEPDALVGQQLSDTEIHALGDMRRECIRCAIQCCDSSPSVLDSEAKMRLLDNIEIMLNTLVDYFEGRSDAELWGDLFRLKGEVENETLSFCLYGACYNTHGRGDNSEMKRLADKMNSLEAQVQSQLLSWCVTRDESLFYLRFILREKVVNVYKRFGSGKVAITANITKLQALRLLQREHSHPVGESVSSNISNRTSSSSSSSWVSISAPSPSSASFTLTTSPSISMVEYDESNPYFVTIDGTSVSLASAVSRQYAYFVHESKAVYGTLLHLALLKGLVPLVRMLACMAKTIRAQDVSLDFSERADSHNFTVAQRCSHFKSFALTFPLFCMAYDKGSVEEAPSWTIKEQLYSDFIQGIKASLDEYSCEALSTPLYYYWSYEGRKIYGTLLHFSLYHGLRDKACYLVRRRVSEAVPDSDGFSVLHRINDTNPAARVWVAGFKAEYDAAKTAAGVAVLQDFVSGKYDGLEDADYLSSDHLVGWCNAAGEMFEEPSRGRHKVRGTLLHYALLRRLIPQLQYLSHRTRLLGQNLASIEDSDLLTPFQRCDANISFAEGIYVYSQAYCDESTFC